MKLQSAANNRIAPRATSVCRLTPRCAASFALLLAIWAICAIWTICMPGGSLAHAASSSAPPCPPGIVSLYTPASANSQTTTLYALLPEVWQARFQQTLVLTPAPGRGGSYAVVRLLDDAIGCSLAAVILPSLYLLTETADRMYNLADLEVAAVLAAAPNALWVAEESPFQSLADLVIHARAENAKPGGFFILAGTGSYTDQHLASLVFDRAAGVRSLYLPVLGSAEAIQAVKNGRASACWGYALAPETMPGMRALGVAAEQRSLALPGVPTFREVHVDMTSMAWFALALRSEIPEEFMPLQGQGLLDALAALMADDDLRARVAARGFTPFALGPQELGTFLEERQQAAALGLATYDLIPRHLRR